MINIKITEHDINIDGHADADVYGKDIVCASVTSITDFIILMLDRTANIHWHREEGKYVIIFNTKKDISSIIQCYIIAVQTIANFNPKHVKVDVQYAWL